MASPIEVENQQAYLRALALCDEGDGADTKAAYELLQVAASQGDDRARYAIATWLIHGEDGVVEVDRSAGVTILKGLAKSNIAEALFDLAVSYDYGRGTRRNEQKAFSCYMRAALLGSNESCEQIAEFIGKGHSSSTTKASIWPGRSGVSNPRSRSPLPIAFGLERERGPTRLARAGSRHELLARRRRGAVREIRDSH